MPEDRTSLNSPGGIASSLSRLTDADRIDPRRAGVMVAAAVGIGLMLCIVAVVIGLRMALHATVVPCPDGHEFPAGTTDFRCFAHKHAGDGTTIVIFAIVLGIVVALAGLIAQLQLRRPSPS